MLGSSHRFVDSDAGNLSAANVNSLDSGLNVYHSPGGGLFVRVTAGEVWLARNGRLARLAVAAVASDQAVAPSTTNYAYLNKAGSLVINSTGFPTHAAHLPLAEVVTSGSTVTAVTDRRPRVVLWHSAPAAPGHLVHTTGRYYAQLAADPGQTVNALEVDTLYLYPLFLQESATFDRIAAEVTTGQAGKLIRLGIYAESAGSPGLPGALVADAGSVSAAASGLKEITLSPSVELGAGRYFLALSSNDVGIALRAYDSALPGAAPLGMAAASTFASAFTAFRATSGAHAPSASLPDPAPGSLTPVALLPVVIGLRVA